MLTNGCFDILHAGHVRYLAEARALGDALLVALNSDRSVAAIKGPGRPVNHEDDRAEVLLALECVDAVMIFSEPTATDVIEAIRPHVYAKGGDYTLDSLNPEERAALEACGAEIRILPLVPGRSTTAILRASAARDPQAKLPRIGILGSGKGTNLPGILAAIGSGLLAAEVAIVLSDVADSGILRLAERYRIPGGFVDPGEHPARLAEPAQREIADRLRAAGVDLVALCGFMRILKAPLLTAFKGRIVNTHPSLLPKFPGREAWKQALEAGEAETGCTIHLVDAGIDTGLILAQETVPVLPADRDNPDALHRRIQSAENLLYPATIQQWLERIGLLPSPPPFPHAPQAHGEG